MATSIHHTQYIIKSEIYTLHAHGRQNSKTKLCLAILVEYLILLDVAVFLYNTIEM